MEPTTNATEEELARREHFRSAYAALGLNIDLFLFVWKDQPVQAAVDPHPAPLWLDDATFAAIEPFFPTHRAGSRTDWKEAAAGWVQRSATGCTWSRLPERVRSAWRTARARGVFRNLLRELPNLDLEPAMRKRLHHVCVDAIKRPDRGKE